MSQHDGDVRLEPLSGDAITPWLGDLANLRITVFREYPYLYEGSAAYEEKYLATYSAAPKAVVVGAFDGERLVGASTALPLVDETDNIKGPMARAGHNVDRYFYFGESVLLPAYRGRGIGVGFFREREAWTRSFGRFTHACFCAIIRSPKDPRRPADYVPLDEFWRNRGYAPLRGVTCEMSWTELGQTDETTNRLQFWGKPLP